MQVLIKLGITQALSAGIALAACLAALADPPVSAQCRVPHFRGGADYGNLLSVSIHRRDFTVDRLICLGRTIRNSRPDLKNLEVLFFTSRPAARNFRGIPVESGLPPAWNKWAKSLHATYSFDAGKLEEDVTILPMGFDTAPTLSSTVKLPLEAGHHCRLEVQNRCLIVAMERITFPPKALKRRAAGMVVLEGTVTRDGRIIGVHQAKSDVEPGPERAELVSAALEDLRTWQFDTAEGDDTVQVTYSFIIDASLPSGTDVRVEWVSPTQVRVRANPGDAQ